MPYFPHRAHRSPALILALLALGVVLAFWLDLALGSVAIPPGELLDILSGGPGARESWRVIVLEFRLPKALTAVQAGAGLAVAGLLMQTLFRNPLAGPFVLGISSGASLGVAVLVLAGAWVPFLLPLTAGWGLVMAAVLGAGLVLLLVVTMAFRAIDNVTLLIIGFMFGAATGALVSVLQFFSDAARIQSFLVWTFGSLGGVTWDQLRVMIPVMGAGFLLSVAVIKPLNALLLGESAAASLGIAVRRSKFAIIAATAVLAGAATAFCGPIAFMGLAVPHLARSALRSSDHRLLVPACLLLGALLMLVFDVISQVPGRDTTLPINAITALFGAPVVIWVILRNRNLNSAF